MKLLDRSHGKHTAERVLDPTDNELLERLEVPDDLSGLHEIPSIGEGVGPQGDEPRRAATVVRWLRWVPVVLLAAAGVVVAAVLLTRDTSETLVEPAVEAPDLVTEGPGSNSLTATWLTRPLVPWQAHEGPGGHSLTIPVAATVTPPVVVRTVITHGPGGHLMDMTWTPSVTPLVEGTMVTHGPGGHLMDTTWVPTVEPIWIGQTPEPAM